METFRDNVIVETRHVDQHTEELLLDCRNWPSVTHWFEQILRPHGILGFQYSICHSFSKAKTYGLPAACETWGNFPDNVYETLNASGLLNFEFSYRCVVELGETYIWAHAPKYFHLMTSQERACDLLYDQLGLSVGVSFALWRTPYWGSGIALWAPHLSAQEFDALWLVHAKSLTALATTFDLFMRRYIVANRFKLTSRERNVLAFVAGGMSPSQAAVHLGVSHRTIEGALSRARQRLRVQNTTEAVAKALLFQLI